MRLELQLANIDQCRKLKELGVEQKGIYSWVWNKLSKQHDISFNSVEYLELLAEANPEDTIWEKRLQKGIFSAWSVAELGLMLPAYIDDLKLTQWPIPGNSSENISFGAQYRKVADVPSYWTFPLHCVFGETEAKVRAEVLICLIADRKIPVEQVNNRLT